MCQRVIVRSSGSCFCFTERDTADEKSRWPFLVIIVLPGQKLDLMKQNIVADPVGPIEGDQNRLEGHLKITGPFHTAGRNPKEH